MYIRTSVFVSFETNAFQSTLVCWPIMQQTSLYKSHTIEDNFKNKLWEGYSIEFKYVKKHMFRPKPQNRRFSDTTKNRDLMTKMQNTAKKKKDYKEGN